MRERLIELLKFDDIDHSYEASFPLPCSLEVRSSTYKAFLGKSVVPMGSIDSQRTVAKKPRPFVVPTGVTLRIAATDKAIVYSSDSVASERRSELFTEVEVGREKEAISLLNSLAASCRVARP